MFSRVLPAWGRCQWTAGIAPRSIPLQKGIFPVERRFFSANSFLHARQHASAAPFSTPQSQKRNASTMYYTISLILGTVALAYGSVPLYKMVRLDRHQSTPAPLPDTNPFLVNPQICQQTGWGGQPILTHRGGDGDTASRVTPQREVRVLPGETALAFYTATNKSPQDIIGVATYSVTPGQVAPYFSKIQCFCFEEQKLNAGESVDMPVFFFIDPDFATDPNMKGIDTITLSYTFFKAKYDDNGVLKPVPGA
ncbi:Cytochrome c oxidase assembly protein CtaG/Cox11 [Penicillium riverlandense]|uniref:Cytochrome c oxidase assembly protein CtaG/Cox11 n=1 Tax=Penicillium riverlandense TaxID=1903569 RepID=UPI002548FCCE|nr:Cytochrome c oxidase assembly protein CtaG/Cox11 [Penicillium riverlandense]KAJ5805265.1 Cytochrome c oxidase assembly protein CtaG/Cox11 [Penicillium riverlandense]